MPSDVAIIHFDDEYSKMLNLLSRRFSRLVYIYHRKKFGSATVQNPRPRNLDELGQDAEAREFDSPADNGQMFSYIFLGSVDAPSDLKKYFTKSTLFVVDVLRYEPGTFDQKLTAAESIESLIKLGVDLNSIVVFTALQGASLVQLKSKYPQVEIISKLNSGDLDKRLLDIVEASLSDD